MKGPVITLNSILMWCLVGDAHTYFSCFVDGIQSTRFDRYLLFSTDFWFPLPYASLPVPVDFTNMVSLADVEQKLESLMGTRQSPKPTVSALSDIIGVVPDSNALSNETDPDNKGVGKDKAPESVEGDQPEASEPGEVKSNEASDAYRIRSDVAEVEPQTDAKPTDTPVDTETPGSINGAMAESSDYTPEPGSHSVAAVAPIDAAKVSHIMQNVCAMFPSTVDPNGVVNDATPFVSINPSYLAKISGEELLFALDEIMFSSVPNELPPHFLSESSCQRVWLDSLREASSAEARSTPLYMLLLARFQHSIYKSFRNLQTDADGEATTAVAPASNASTKAQENVVNDGTDEAKVTETTPEKDDSVVGNATSQTLCDSADSTEPEENPGAMEPTDVSVIPAPVANPLQPSSIEDDAGKEEPKADGDQPQSVAENLVGSEAATSFENYKPVSLGLLLMSGSTKCDDGSLSFQLSEEFFFETSTEEAQITDSNSEVEGSSANKVATTSQITDTPAVVKTKSGTKKNDAGWMDESVPAPPAGGSPSKKNGKKKKKKKVSLRVSIS